MSECHEGGTKHNFQPRFSIISPHEKSIKELAFQGSGSEVTNQIEKSQGKIYECDVCIWCGKVVGKKDSDPPKNMKSTIYCEHTNEMPAQCPCPDDCYCKQNSCKTR